MDFAKLGINIFESTNGGPPLSVVFDDYSVRPQLFRYGSQPPDFNGTAFAMQPYKDKDDDELGVALFFSVLFDKLSICECSRRTTRYKHARLTSISSACRCVFSSPSRIGLQEIGAYVPADGKRLVLDGELSQYW
jgi:hypothetical protein